MKDFAAVLAADPNGDRIDRDVVQPHRPRYPAQDALALGVARLLLGLRLIRFGGCRSDRILNNFAGKEPSASPGTKTKSNDIPLAVSTAQ